MHDMRKAISTHCNASNLRKTSLTLTTKGFSLIFTLSDFPSWLCVYDENVNMSYSAMNVRQDGLLQFVYQIHFLSFVGLQKKCIRLELTA